MVNRTWVAAGLLALALGVAGCDAGTPESSPAVTSSATPSPTPSPTLDPAEAKEQAAVAAATETLTTLVRAADETAQAGYADFAPLNGLVGGDLRVRLLSLYEQSRDIGAHQTGTTILEDITVVKFLPGPERGGGEQVILEACSDNTSKDVLLADGSSGGDPAYPKRLIVSYTVQNTDGHWTVDTSESDPARTC